MNKHLHIAALILIGGAMFVTASAMNEKEYSENEISEANQQVLLSSRKWISDTYFKNNDDVKKNTETNNNKEQENFLILTPGDEDLNVTVPKEVSGRDLKIINALADNLKKEDTSKEKKQEDSQKKYNMLNFAPLVEVARLMQFLPGAYLDLIVKNNIATNSFPISGRIKTTAKSNLLATSKP